jgi:sporulation protein YlmC with PRC-barrel domain
MILSDLLANQVLDADGEKLGKVIDARFVLEGNENPSQARLLGLIVSPRSSTSFLGYERTAMSKPVIVNKLLTWMHRGSFLVLWDDIEMISEKTVMLRPGFHKEPSSLPD